MTPTDPKRPTPPVIEEKGGFRQTYQNFKEKFGLLNQPVLIYGFLIVSLFFLLFAPFIGGLLLGGLAGLVFSNEILDTVTRIKEAIEEDEISRGVILGVLCLAFLITTPGIMIGAALVVTIKKLLSLIETSETTPSTTPTTPPKTDNTKKP